MKINTLQQQIKSTVIAGLGVSCLWSFPQPVRAADDAAEIDIQNHSFEDDFADPLGNPLDAGPGVPQLFLDTPEGWERYGGAGTVGSLYVDFHEGQSTWFTDDTPDGNRVLLLYTNNANGGNPYGAEKVLTTIEAECRYTLTVDVGNIASSWTSYNAAGEGVGQYYNLDGFPIYRIQLFAGDMVVPLEQDFASLEIAEGEFETSTISVDIPDDSPFIGQPLRLRLQNENNGLGLDPSNRIEVDFDNVRLTTEPIDTDNFWIRRASVENIALATSSYDDPDVVEIDFDIEDGETSLMVIGTSHSMNTTVANLAIDPAIRIINRVTGEVVELLDSTIVGEGPHFAESDNWMDQTEGQEGSVIDVVDGLVNIGNHNLLSTKSPLDAGRILNTIGVGQYTAQLISLNEDGVYAGLKLFAFNNHISQTGNVTFPSMTELAIEEMLKPEPKFEIKESKEKEPTREKPTQTKRVFSTKTAIKK